MIALIGPPGSGKTSVGAALAQLAGLPFVDLDAEVARRFGNPADIVIHEGDAALRTAEAAILAELVEEGADAVLAVGSGVVDSGAALAELGRTTVVYLSSDLAHTFPRAGMARPQPVGLVNPRSLWAQMLREREPRYLAAADHVVEVGDDDVAAVAARVGALLGLV